MKYFADYINERIYEINEYGDGFMRDIDGTYPVHKDSVPWSEEENEVIWFVEPMTNDEYDTFGKKWLWAKSPLLAEKSVHSWRNYMQML